MNATNMRLSCNRSSRSAHTPADLSGEEITIDCLLIHGMLARYFASRHLAISDSQSAPIRRFKNLIKIVVKNYTRFFILLNFFSSLFLAAMALRFFLTLGFS
jgi:hypothetical protein